MRVRVREGQQGEGRVSQVVKYTEEDSVHVRQWVTDSSHVLHTKSCINKYPHNSKSFDNYSIFIENHRHNFYKVMIWLYENKITNNRIVILIIIQ